MSENKIYEGHITITRRGIGFFSYDDNQEDLLIQKEDLNTALPGDTVKVVKAGTAPGESNAPASGVIGADDGSPQAGAGGPSGGASGGRGAASAGEVGEGTGGLY